MFKSWEIRGSDPCLVINSFDPGVTTGWSIHRIPIKELVSEGFKASIHCESFCWNSGEIYKFRKENQTIADMLKVSRFAWSLAEEENGDVFVIILEDFILDTLDSSRDLLSPVRINAKFDYAMKDSGICIVMQLASEAMWTVTDARLKSWGLYKAGLQHARDAQRHAILFARKYASKVDLRNKIDAYNHNGHGAH